jgi:hypothetical protein
MFETKSKKKPEPKEPAKKKTVKEPVKNKPKPKPKPKVKAKSKQITVEYQGPTETINESKYSEKIKSLIDKIKNQNTDIDHGIRFCWKN